MPEVIVKFSDMVIERVVTEKDHISIGRTSDNDIVLDNRGVSRRHARIELSGVEPELIDLDSLNGTFVNGEKVNRRYLHDNDTISIGKFSLIFFRDCQSNSKIQVKSINKQQIQDQEATADTEAHNPLETFMETRPIPVSLGTGTRAERKEQR